MVQVLEVEGGEKSHSQGLVAAMGQGLIGTHLLGQPERHIDGRGKEDCNFEEIEEVKDTLDELNCGVQSENSSTIRI